MRFNLDGGEQNGRKKETAGVAVFAILGIIIGVADLIGAFVLGNLMELAWL